MHHLKHYIRICFHQNDVLFGSYKQMTFWLQIKRGLWNTSFVLRQRMAVLCYYLCQVIFSITTLSTMEIFCLIYSMLFKEAKYFIPKMDGLSVGLGLKKSEFRRKLYLLPWCLGHWSILTLDNFTLTLFRIPWSWLLAKPQS